MTFVPDEPSKAEQDMKVFEKAAAFVGLAFSARAILLTAVLGAIILGMIAMAVPSWTRVAALIAYCLITIVPLVGLEIRRQKP